jgi:hypothetical protein
VHTARIDQIAGRARIVERGKDRSVRVGLRDMREDAFGAAALV